MSSSKKAPRRWGGEQDSELTALHGSGKSLGECARSMGWGRATVSRHAKRLGLDWSNPVPVEALQVAAERNRQSRARIIEKLYAAAEGDLDRLGAPTWQTLVKVKGSDQLVGLTTVPPRDRRDTYDGVYKALASAKNLEALDAPDTGAAARGLLVDLAARLGLAGSTGEADPPAA